MVTKDEIKHIAKLSKLQFIENELEKFEKEFNSILDYVSQVKECDVSGIEFEHNMSDYKGKVLNEDIAKKGLDKKAALKNATQGREKLGYIKTSKMIEK